MKRAAPDARAIASLYDAAADDEGWHDFARRVAVAVGLEGGVVMLTENGALSDVSATEDFIASWPDYQSYYGQLDPWSARWPRSREGIVKLSAEIFPENEFQKTEFYNDFARHYGIMCSLGSYGSAGPGRSFGIGLGTPYATSLDAEYKPVLASLLPHVRQAMALRSRLRALGTAADLARRGLDALAFGALICDDGGRVLLANAEAERLARAGIGFFLDRGGAFGALLPAEGLKLRALVHDAATGGAGGGMRLTGPDGAIGLFALVTPLPASLGGEAGSRALLALRRPRELRTPREKLLVDLFGLSRSQAAVAVAVYEGKAPSDIAAERGARVSTVRTQLLEIFSRTGARDQRDLVRLIGALPPLK